MGESPDKSWGQPAAVVVARTRLRKPPSHTNAYRAKPSPRNLLVGVAISIGSIGENPARAQQSEHVRRRCLRTRAYGCKRGLGSSYSSPSTRRARLEQLFALQESSRASQCLQSLQRAAHSCPPRLCMQLRVTLLSAVALGLNAQLKKTAHPQRQPLMAAAPPPPGPLDYSHSHPCIRWFRSTTLPLRVPLALLKGKWRARVCGAKRPTWNPRFEAYVTALRSATKNAPRDVGLLRAATSVSVPGPLLPAGVLRCTERLARPDGSELAVEFVWPRQSFGAAQDSGR